MLVQDTCEAFRAHGGDRDHFVAACLHVYCITTCQDVMEACAHDALWYFCAKILTYKQVSLNIKINPTFIMNIFFQDRVSW